MASMDTEPHQPASEAACTHLDPALLQQILDHAVSDDSSVLHTAPLVSRTWAAVTRAPPALRVHLPRQAAAASKALHALGRWLACDGRAQVLRTLTITGCIREGITCGHPFLFVAMPLPGLTRLEVLGKEMWCYMKADGASQLVQAMPQLACLRLDGGCVFNAECIQELTGLARLTALTVSLTHRDAAAALGCLTQLRSLDLSHGGLAPENATALLSALTQLTQLSLRENCNPDVVAAAAQLGGSLRSLEVTCSIVGSIIGDRMHTIAASLTSLTSLVISRCCLHPGAQLAALASMTQLRRLEVAASAGAGQDIAADVLAELRVDLEVAQLASALTQLTHLGMGDSLAWSGDCAALTQLTGLVSLDIHRNRADASTLHTSTLHTSTLHSLASELTGLTSLNVSGCAVDQDGAAALARMFGLRSLSAASNQLGDAGVSILAAALPGLTQLDVGCNGLGGAGVAALAQLTGLRRLSMEFSAPDVDGVRVMAAALTNLVFLSAPRCRLGPCHAAALTALTKLTRLDLGGQVDWNPVTGGQQGYNDIQAAGLRAVAQLSQLRHLNVQFNRFDASACTLLAPLTRLTRLEASNTQWRLEQVAQLEDALPFAVIDFMPF